jgi:lipopolysaccharide export system protein LptA
MVPAPVWCQTEDEPAKPSGTLLLPLTPKIEEDKSADEPGNNTVLLPLTPKIDDSAKALNYSDETPKPTKGRTAPGPTTATKAATLGPAPHVEAATTASPGSVAAQGQANISAENGDESEAANDIPAGDEALLKGTVQITADDTEFDQDKNTFLGTGNAVAVIGGQDSKLSADSILYDENNNTIDARGDVKIVRSGQLTTGSAFKFKVDSDEYLVTEPNTELHGTTVISRSARGNKTGVLFRNGSFTLDKPFHIMNNAGYGPISEAEQVGDEMAHPDAYVTQHPTYHITGRRMVLERYKDDQNLTVYGGRMQFGKFYIPLGNFVANVGTGNSRVVFPRTPLIGNNLMVGGTNIGPQFNYAVGKTGAFSWAPLLQYGGSLSGTNSNTTTGQSGKLGAGFKVGFTDDVLSSHLAYGSVSNLLVADLKYRINKKTFFQSGINRFLNNGMFGIQRARLLAEVVNNQGISNIPYIAYLNFRTSAGWAQDNPALLALSGSQYANLFTQTHTGKVSAYRIQEQVTASSHPIFAVGDQKNGVDLRLSGGVAARAYSSGDRQLIGQVGPMLTARLSRARLRIGYNQAAVRGTSPFVFDEFIQGNQSTYVQGDVKITRWLTLGGSLGYNLTNKLLYQKAVTAAIGPEDFKLIFSQDFITNYQRFGFDVMYGQPVNFNALKIKNSPDAGQLGMARAGGI